MTGKQHTYAVAVRWTGNRGDGTRTYAGYSRDHEVSAAGKPVLPGSSDPGFRGDPTRYNPEELLVAALSTCHMLWFLHLCADARIVVTEYTDDAHGVMVERADGGGQFTEVTLRPSVRVQDAFDESQIAALHERAHHRCFIASSVNFPVKCEPSTAV
jgi:organic hydroperoxide reductase OsmC/OhrA